MFTKFQYVYFFQNWPSLRAQKWHWGTQKRQLKFDRDAEKKKFIPGVGSYKKFETSFDALSVPNVLLRRRR